MYLVVKIAFFSGLKQEAACRISYFTLLFSRPSVRLSVPSLRPSLTPLSLIAVTTAPALPASSCAIGRCHVDTPVL